MNSISERRLTKKEIRELISYFKANGIEIEYDREKYTFTVKEANKNASDEVKEVQSN